jgi:hypothetical protein
MRPVTRCANQRPPGPGERAPGNWCRYRPPIGYFEVSVLRFLQSGATCSFHLLIPLNGTSKKSGAKELQSRTWPTRNADRILGMLELAVRA